jgi:hypothetical protein
MSVEEGRPTTAERIASGRLPIPRWVSIRRCRGVVVACNRCEDAIDAADKCFDVVLQDEVCLLFHDECFEIYNRSTHGRRDG